MYQQFRAVAIFGGRSHGRLQDRRNSDQQAPGRRGARILVGFVAKDKVVPPEAMTWDFEEIVAGGQGDRYAIVETFAPYGTLINDPKLSKTGGKWAWDTVPGRQTANAGPDLGRRPLPRHSEIHQEQGLVAGIHRMACSKEFMKRSMIRGNAPPRGRCCAIRKWSKRSAGPRWREGDRDRHSNAGGSGLPDTRTVLASGPVADAARPEDPEEALDDLADDWPAHAPRREGR